MLILKMDPLILLVLVVVETILVGEDEEEGITNFSANYVELQDIQHHIVFEDLIKIFNRKNIINNRLRILANFIIMVKLRIVTMLLLLHLQVFLVDIQTPSLKPMQQHLKVLWILVGMLTVELLHMLHMI